MRKRIFEIIEVTEDGDRLGVIYDTFMMFAILISILPLAFKEQHYVFIGVNIITAVIFAVDYILRLITADYKLNKGIKSFLLYPFTLWAIIDLLSLMSYMSFVHVGFRLLRLTRFVRLLRIFRVFKAFRYSKSIRIIVKVIVETKESLIAVAGFAIGYIIISALLVFNIEPNTFKNFFDALYWATMSLTTVGYGDIYPVSTIGKMVTMLSSLFGVAIVALPAGVLTAGYMDVLKSMDDD